MIEQYNIVNSKENMDKMREQLQFLSVYIPTAVSVFILVCLPKHNPYTNATGIPKFVNVYVRKCDPDFPQLWITNAGKPTAMDMLRLPVPSDGRVSILGFEAITKGRVLSLLSSRSSTVTATGTA